ncbi:hypothetical protein N7456_000954 [Penicillium angulare]|uniref:Nucleotidyltransferase family protein n=1 Tax=Penicillium angulare TaxID=116970 RepID=A0A9W9GD37_9EURO|nr:hypothetical protein N7456_000954 [Penicillium angulare]
MSSRSEHSRRSEQPRRTSPGVSFEPTDTQKYDHLDAAADAVRKALIRADVECLFIGGYAATLLGSNRLTEDVDMVVSRECLNRLVETGSFARTSDDRLLFQFRGRKVYIDLHVGMSRIKNFPIPQPSVLRSLTVGIGGGTLKSRPLLRDSRLYILHPEILLYTKLIPWARASFSTRQDAVRKAQKHIQDVIAIATWLVTTKCVIEWSKFRGYSNDDFLWLLGYVYRKSTEMRPLVAQIISPDDMKTALTISIDMKRGKSAIFQS